MLDMMISRTFSVLIVPGPVHKDEDPALLKSSESTKKLDGSIKIVSIHLLI